MKLSALVTNLICFVSLSVYCDDAPLQAIDNQSAAEQDVPSFYGGRGVATGNQNSHKINIQYQRRVIAPAIVPELPPQLEPSTTQNEDMPSTESMVSTSTQIDLSLLSRNDWLLAKKAKHYFETNYQPTTGLWNSVQGYQHATMWDVASGLSAILALFHLELVSEELTRDQLDKTLSTLIELPLYKGLLPNREYNTLTGQPSGRYSETATNGNGWSALDIGRLLIWLRITQHYFPALEDKIDRITKRWVLDRSVHEHTLYGTKLYQGKEYYRQEGRLGYLQYAAQGFVLYGYELEPSFSFDHTSEISIQGIKLHIDQRNLPYFTTDPYVLLAIELGNPDTWWNQLTSLYQLHQKQYQRSGELYAYAEDAMDKSPWFAYNNIYYYGKSWLSVSPGGKPIETPQIFSNKVAFAMSVLFDDPFADKLIDNVVAASLSSRSVPTGIYSNGGINRAYNINTNALILTALWFKARGQQPIYPSSLYLSK